LPIRTNTALRTTFFDGGNDSLESVEKEHILRVLKKNSYHKSRTAGILGVTRKTLDRKIADYELTIPKSSFEAT
jgi:DNA-binding NtrC family response regulator